MSDELTPITRKETFLAKAGGQNVVTPTPITREETFLQAIIDNGSGGGGGGGTGVLVVNVTPDGGGMVMDKTYQEIADADLCVVKMAGEDALYTFWIIGVSTGSYSVYVLGIDGEDNTMVLTFSADSADGYPSYR